MNELSENAKSIFEKLYSFSGESIDDTFRRVAREFANSSEEEELAYSLQKNNIWRPNTPAYLNAGTKHKIFSACYCVDLEDSMESIYDIASVAMRIFKCGAGIGIPIGNLREAEAYIYEGEPDHAPEGKSSGPLVFLKLYDAVGDTTKSGGRVRRAAILCDMQVSHPDIMNFIRCKEIDGRLANMNISVAITDDFMKALKDNIPFSLITPYDGSKVGEVDPSNLWSNLVEMNWRTADPGVIFIDIVNKYNVLKKRYTIKVLNPCSEQCLPGFFACNLSAINLRKFVNEEGFDFQSFYKTVHDIMRLMDNVIDKMDYPDPRFKENSIKYRQVGIGPMGLADAMFALDIKYDSSDGRKFAGEIMRTMTSACLDCSSELANEKGRFHDYDVFKDDVESIMLGFIKGHERESIVKDKILKYGIRNSSVTTCMPTGTTAISCDASYGIEPCFGLVFQKNLIDGTIMKIVNPVFEERFKDYDWYTDTLIDKIFDNGGSLKGIRGIPKEVREVFVTAHDIKPKDRIDIQSEMQKHNSSAISSTLNLSKDATLDDISNIYKYAYEKGLKGVTVYRDGSKKNQPITFTKENKIITEFERPSKLNAEVFTIDTGNGKMYVTVSTIEGKPIEIFLHIGKSGQLLSNFSEALGRTISIALQHGVPVESIVRTLLGINSDHPTWYRFEESDIKPSQILSVPDGIAQLLDRYYIKNEKDDTPFMGDICPSCQRSTLLMIEGCKTCTNCAYSACS